MRLDKERVIFDNSTFGSKKAKKC